jgi:hypothetical protein
MKKIAFLLVPFCLLLIYSCDKKENLLELDIPQSDPESKIADLEKSGVTLYKRDLKIADATGENFVIVQVASEDEGTLNNYLQNTKFRLSLGEDLKQFDFSKSTPKIDTNLSAENADIYDVVLFKKIDSKYKVYTIKYEHPKTKNARIKGVNDYANDTWHQSNQFDDWMNVTWYSVGNSDEGITVGWEHKNCAFCSWTSDYSVGLYAGNPSSTHDPDARRLGCRVYHNFYNYNVSYGNY